MFRYYCNLISEIFQSLSRWQGLSTRALTIIFAVMLFFNEPIGKMITETYAGISPKWALLPIALAAIWGFLKINYDNYDSLRQENINLKEAIRPRLEIIFQPGQEPFEHTEPMGCQGRAALRSFRIRVHNLGNEMLSHCTVELTNLSCGTAFPNMKLKLQGDDPYDSRHLITYPYKQEFSLLAYGEQLIDVVQMREQNVNSQIELCYAAKGAGSTYPPRTIVRQDLILYITIFCNTGESLKPQFRAWVEDGYLRMKQIA